MGPQQSYDVVVLGTGAAGMVAALAASDGGASVGLFEKSDLLGGTTAISGSIAWIPANQIAAAAGVEDSPQDALAYLDALSLGLIDRDLAEVLISTGPELIDYLQSRTPVRLALIERYPDYHPEHPGGKPGGGRSLEPGLFAFEELGEWAQRITPTLPGVKRLRVAEQKHGGGSGEISAQAMREREAHDIRACGHALVGALLRGCLDRGIEPVTSARARELILADGRVGGVVIDHDGERLEVRARRGVVIATGGFEWNEELVRTFLRGPMTAPASVPTNTGDGLVMAMKVGASLGNMREAWWMPVFQIPGDEYQGQQRSILTLRERTVPGTIMVNRAGVRFTNEASNYNAQGAALHAFDMASFDYANLPCWIVFDERCFRRYGFSVAPPDSDPPDWIARGDSLAQLAARIGVPATALEATVARFNGNVAELGRDPDFGRGDSGYDHWNGDQTLPGHSSTLGPLDSPPYYAVEIQSGTLGTKGGPRTDADGRVIDLDGNVIEGLYAAGNAMAGVTGMVYGGAGGTIGPAMVFGYRAGRHAAGLASAQAEVVASAAAS
jgi:succinate dehydrogenase/fumarate reductase flavoprotein subunit